MQREEEPRNAKAARRRKREEQKERSDMADHDPYYTRNPRTNRHNKATVVNRERGLGVYYQLGNNNTPISIHRLEETTCLECKYKRK